VVPPIRWVFCHAPPDLFEHAPIEMSLFEELPVAVVATFQFGHYMTRDWKATFFIEMGDVVDIVHVHDEPAHLFGDLRLGVFDSEEDGRELLTDGGQLT